MLSLEKAAELVAKLERTRNYPREPDGVQNLARGLQKASEALKIAGGRIVERCAETSEFCPTDADLFTIARDLARLDGVATGSYDSMANAANSAQPLRRKVRCTLCRDTGWIISYALHTSESGSHNFIKKEWITEAQSKELEGKLDPQTQRIYTGARRCKCPVQPDDWGKAAAGDRD